MPNSTSEPLLSHIRDFPHDSGSLEALSKGNFLEVLTSWQARRLFHHEDLSGADATTWYTRLSTLIRDVASDPATPLEGFHSNDYLILGTACLHAFLQANVTGPPLSWSPAEACLPEGIRGNSEAVEKLKEVLVAGLSVDGEAVYRRVPGVELFAIAKLVCNHASVVTESVAARWARLRINVWHQRLLSEPAASLMQTIKEDLGFLDLRLLNARPEESVEVRAHYLLEKAAVHTLHGEDRKAREALDETAKITGFQFALTGRLGKRTKFQTFDVSQLVVLAKSAGTSKGKEKESSSDTNGETKPENIDLDDDTLLERISFTKDAAAGDPKIEENVPAALSDVDPENQPTLNPLDSIHLLSLASSITNTSPQNGLTREETLPYATRVLEGGSSNWQIYSQALLVRSRIEGYKSRTVERGVLQMQALVDQVIAETTDPSATTNSSPGDSATTFLPRPKPSESAAPTERLQYIHPLASPARWTLEAELAERWVAIGGLRTALEIYTRLEMWAEAALCWASLQDEAKARTIIVDQLYQDPDQKIEKTPLPNDAPRLFCILGDIGNDPILYERAWSVSNNRYARAQRSLGKHYFKSRNLEEADKAYTKSLSINPQNAPAWFTLGCIRLETKSFAGAVECFSRVVQRESDDAEAWSNLAAALLRLPPTEDANDAAPILDDEDTAAVAPSTKSDPQKHTRQAFAAFKRAAKLKRESHRIWQNLLNVAATLAPPPYNDIIVAQKRIIELRGGTEGEGCVDVEVMEGLLAHVIQIKQEQTPEESAAAEAERPERRRMGLEHMFVELVQKHITPLITHSRRLWKLVAKLNTHLNRPGSALEAYEKAWRVTLNRPGWDNEAVQSGKDADGQGEDGDGVWRAVVESTVELVDAYESLGEREVTEGLKAGSGELVCKNWQYKGRMAVRSVVGRRTKAGLAGTEELEERMEMLKAT